MSAPSLANRKAVARPMPRDPPVMRATRWLNSFVMTGSSLQFAGGRVCQSTVSDGHRASPSVTPGKKRRCGLACAEGLCGGHQGEETLRDYYGHVSMTVGP